MIISFKKTNKSGKYVNYCLEHNNEKEALKILDILKYRTDVICVNTLNNINTNDFLLNSFTYRAVMYNQDYTSAQIKYRIEDNGNIEDELKRLSRIGCIVYGNDITIGKVLKMLNIDTDTVLNIALKNPLFLKQMAGLVYKMYEWDVVIIYEVINMIANNIDWQSLDRLKIKEILYQKLK